VVELDEVDKCLLREDRVGADPQNLGILCRELSVVVVRTGRLKVLDSGGAKVQDIKVDENVLPFKTAELEFASFGAVKLKVGGLLSDLYSRSSNR
jgi:hypothetical protein